MARVGAIALLLLALGSVAAARTLDEPSANGWSHSIIDALKEGFGDSLEIEGAAFDQTNEDVGTFDRFYLLLKYVVRPSLSKKFSHKWMHVREEILEQKGAVRISLSKTLTDNLVYYSYEEWESKEDFVRYLKSQKEHGGRGWKHFIEEHDIPLVLTGLKPMVVNKETAKGGHRHGGRITKHAEVLGESMYAVAELMSDLSDTIQDWWDAEAAETGFRSGDERSPHKAYLLVKYMVPPGTAGDFVDQVAMVSSKATEEAGSEMYSLSKTTTDNVSFLSYLVFKDEEAIKTHLKSSYAQSLKQFIDDHNIYTRVMPLIPIEAMED